MVDLLGALDRANLFDRPAMVRPPHFWVEHIPYAYFLVSSLRPRSIVELGVHSGNSFNAFCQAVQACGSNTRCSGVDTWKGDEHTGPYEEEVYQTLLGHLRERYADFASLLRMTFDEALARFSDGSVDLLHIDGFHSYEAVRHDFESWLPKLSERGVVVLHDIAVKEADFGVWRLWDEISARYPSLAFPHGSGLGTVAVGAGVPPDFLETLAAIDASPFCRQLFARLGGHLALVEKNRELESALAEKSAATGKTEWFAKLYVDTGLGFNESQALLQPVGGGERLLEFDLGSFRGATQVRFDPADDLAAIHVDAVRVHLDGGETRLLESAVTNAQFPENGNFVFPSADPHIFYSLAGIEGARKISIALQYVALGTATWAYVVRGQQQRLEEAWRTLREAQRGIDGLQQTLAEKERALAAMLRAEQARPINRAKAAAARLLGRSRG